MQRIQILRFLALLSVSALFCAPSFGVSSADEALQSRLSPVPDAEHPCERVPQETNEITPLQLTLERAYMQNAELDAARAGLRATDEDVAQAEAEWRPSLSVEGSQGYEQHYPINRGINNIKGHTNTLQYRATLSQNIYKGGGTVAKIGETESNVVAGKAGLFITEQQTLFDAVKSHTAVTTNAEILGYQHDKENFMKKLLEHTQARYEVGEVSRTDVAASEGEYEGAQAAVSEAIGNLESAKATYGRVIGNPPGKLNHPNVILELPKCYKEALEAAKARNPRIRQALFQLEAAEYVVDEKIATLLPEVNLQGTAGNDRRSGTTIASPPAHPKRTNLGFEAVVTVPIYRQGIPSSQIRQAYQLVAQKKVELVSAQRQVVESVRTAWENLIAAQNSVKSLLVEVKAQELAVEGALEEYNVGVKSIVDVIFLQQKLTDSQTNLARAREQLVLATYGVLQSMGRLTACELRLRVKYYDPDAYYNEYKDAWIKFWQDEDWRYVKDECVR
jgi:outer membrane protein